MLCREDIYSIRLSLAGKRPSRPLPKQARCLEQQKCIHLEVPGGIQSAALILAKVNGLQLWVTCWNISSFLKNKLREVFWGAGGEVLK